jgi:predicted ATPase
MQKSHPFTLAFARAQALILQQFHRIMEQCTSAEALALSVEREFPFWLAYGTILRGWTLAMQGRTSEGIVQMRQGLATWQRTGAELERSYWLALVAEGYGKGGQVDAGLQTLDECFVAVANTGECWWEAELYRLKGELLLQSRGSDLQSAILIQVAGSRTGCRAETSSLQALTRLAAGKPALELRAALSLGRLWQSHGKSRKARELLAPIYGWFTEGFDTTDLREAKALLDELS